nr:hypothetical protein [Thiocapsa marina]
MTLLQRDLVDTADLQRLDPVPIDLGLYAAIQNAMQSIDSDGVLETHILERTVDQLEQHLLLEGLRDRGACRIPGQRLARCRPPLAVVALTAFGSQNKDAVVIEHG